MYWYLDYHTNLGMILQVQDMSDLDTSFEWN